MRREVFFKKESILLWLNANVIRSEGISSSTPYPATFICILSASIFSLPVLFTQFEVDGAATSDPVHYVQLFPKLMFAGPKHFVIFSCCTASHRSGQTIAMFDISEYEDVSQLQVAAIPSSCGCFLAEIPCNSSVYIFFVLVNNCSSANSPLHFSLYSCHAWATSLLFLLGIPKFMPHLLRRIEIRRSFIEVNTLFF